MISAMPDDAPKPVAGLRSFTLPGATLAGRSPSDVLHELVDTQVSSRLAFDAHWFTDFRLAQA